MKALRVLGLVGVAVEGLYFGYGLWWAATSADLLSTAERASWGLSLALALLGVGISAFVLRAAQRERRSRRLLEIIGCLTQAVLVMAGVASGELGLLLLGIAALVALVALAATVLSRRARTASTV